jgi:glycerophosphoryl diester phosphodiesterase
VSALVLGHRGDPEHHAENTLPGFLAAVACGADGVELDVQVTADGVPVVVHDDTLDRTTALRGRVDAHTWQQLEGAVPRLDTVLDALRGHVVAVELKPGYEAQPDLAARVLEMSADVWLLAFDHRHLAAVRGRAECVALVEARPVDPLLLLEKCGAATLGPWWEHVDASLCATLHAAGRAVLAWTVDDDQQARRLAALGVRALVSNRPCALRAQ